MFFALTMMKRSFLFGRNACARARVKTKITYSVVRCRRSTAKRRDDKQQNKTAQPQCLARSFRRCRQSVSNRETETYKKSSTNRMTSSRHFCSLRLIVRFGCDISIGQPERMSSKMIVFYLLDTHLRSIYTHQRERDTRCDDVRTNIKTIFETIKLAAWHFVSGVCVTITSICV